MTDKMLEIDIAAEGNSLTGRRQPAPAASLGRSLKVWRALNRVKQMQAADLLAVSQGTISRWESGRLTPNAAEQIALRRLMQARLSSAADQRLAELVTGAGAPMHLICDLTHRLLAWSPTRAREALTNDNLIGTSLWRYASDELRETERRLPELGWYQPAPPALIGRTGANHSHRFRIRPSRFRFTRFQLSDGSFARLVETLAA